MPPKSPMFFPVRMGSPPPESGIRDLDEDPLDRRDREREESASPQTSRVGRGARMFNESGSPSGAGGTNSNVLERKPSIMSAMSQGSFPRSPTDQRLGVDLDRAEVSSQRSQRSQAKSTALSRKSTFRQTQMKNVEAFKREGIHRPLLSRDFPQARVPSIGVLAGFLNFFQCDHAITIAKELSCDTNDENIHMRIMTEGERDNFQAIYGEDEITNTIVMAPALLIGFLLAIVLYCSIIVFWAPDARLYDQGGLPWSGGDLNAVEALMPIIMALLYVIAITYANTLGISLSMVERQYIVEPEVLTSLQGREVGLNKEALEVLVKVQTNKPLPFLRPSLIKKIRWYVQEGHESIPADLYLNYINSLACFTAAKEYKVSYTTGIVNVALPAIVACSPVLARLFRGGSIWGKGLAEEFALVVCGCALTLFASYGVVAMLNVFAFTMRFHRYRMEWLTLALPDPTRLSESSWPIIPFDSIENLLIWHRMRSAILKPPMALYLWGRRLSEVTFLLFCLLVIVSMAYNFVSSGAGNSSFEGTTALMIGLLITLAPLLLFIFYTPLRSTFLRQEQVESLNNILMLSVKDMGLQRGAPGVTDEVLMRISDIRSCLKTVARSIAAEEEVITFLGFPLSVYTMLLMVMVFTFIAGLVLMRAVYGRDAAF